MIPDLIGKTLGKYRILEEIGQGGMGVVYKARDTILDRPVAIKILYPRFTRDSEFVERFLREARAAARFKHPNIVAIYDIDQAESYHFIAMEYVAGRPLSELIRRQGALPPKQVLRILSQLAEALDYAHARGIIHRDVKPGNVIVGPQGHATLTDFGVAKAAAETRLTQTGTLLGTPAYMAPEQITGQPVGPAADLYSLGVVAYEMLGGRPPFEGDTHRLLYAHVHEEPPSLSQVNQSVPRAVASVVKKALAKQPEDRWPSARAFAAALKQAITTGKTPHIERTPSGNGLWYAIGALGAFLLLLVLGVGAWNFGPPLFERLKDELDGLVAVTHGTPTPTRTAPLTTTPTRSPAIPPAATATEGPTVTSSPRPPATATTTLTRMPTATPTRTRTATIPPTRTRTATLIPTRTATATIPPTPRPDAVVASEALNLRAGPDTAYPVRAELRRGTALDVIARTSDSRWLQVIAPGGTRGWVFGDLVTLSISLRSVPIASTIPTPPAITPATRTFRAVHKGCIPGTPSDVGVVKGRVLDRNGKPLAGWKVGINIFDQWWDSWENPKATDVDGWYGWNHSIGHKITFVLLKDSSGRQVNFTPAGLTVEATGGCFQRVDFEEQ